MSDVVPGQIVELGEFVYRIETLQRLFDGTLAAMTAKCLNPGPDHNGEWAAIEVTDEDLIVAHTLH